MSIYIHDSLGGYILRVRRCPRRASGLVLKECSCSQNQLPAPEKLAAGGLDEYCAAGVGFTLEMMGSEKPHRELKWEISVKEGKYALNWTRLSCHRFDANQVRLQLFILAYNPGNFLRRLGVPKAVRTGHCAAFR